MTSENAMYGVDWVKCAKCGVTVPRELLVELPKGTAPHCGDLERCARWKLEVEAKHGR